MAAHYEQTDDGSFVLRVEGMAAKAGWASFRDNSIRLDIERDRLAKAPYEDARTEEIERLVNDRTAGSGGVSIAPAGEDHHRLGARAPRA